MAIWFRISTYSNQLSVFSGDGGLSVAGRWNYRGTRAIYCSESIALCTLEWLSHNGLTVSEFSYYRYSIEVSDKMVRKFSLADLPKGWNKEPPTEASRNFAKQNLFDKNEMLAISVPSVMVAEESNLIINPNHPEFIKIADTIRNLGRYATPNHR